MTPEEKQAIKIQATLMAGNYNNLAAAFTGAAAVLGLFNPPAAAVYGILSAIFWWSANQYQEIAGDPPRADFDVIVPTYLSLSSSQLSGDPIVDASDAGGKEVAALHNLLVSIERHAGSQIVPRRESREARAIREMMTVGQASAARSSAEEAAAAVDRIAGLAPKINSHWSALKSQNPGPFVSPTVAEAIAAFDKYGAPSVMATLYRAGMSAAEVAECQPPTPRPQIPSTFTLSEARPLISNVVIIQMRVAAARLRLLVGD